MAPKRECHWKGRRELRRRFGPRFHADDEKIGLPRFVLVRRKRKWRACVHLDTCCSPIISLSKDFFKTGLVVFE